LIRPNRNNDKQQYPRAMTAQQYLLSQAEHCRRTAADSTDPFASEELKRLAAEFERRARLMQGSELGTQAA
jgi:hypothetical protein